MNKYKTITIRVSEDNPILDKIKQGENPKYSVGPNKAIITFKGNMEIDYTFCCNDLEEAVDQGLVIPDLSNHSLALCGTKHVATMVACPFCGNIIEYRAKF